MIIKLDCREIKLHELCLAAIAADTEASSINLISESLPLGDIIICDDEGKEKVIIERKSLADLAASIRDGRYSEQGFRLNQCDLHNHQIYYVIEGDLRYYRPYKGLPDKKALLSAMVSISYFKGFSHYRTINLEETAEWVIHFAKKLIKEGPKVQPFYLGNQTITSAISTSEQASEYTKVVAGRIKKDNITHENIGEIMLSQIPSVSSASAIAIMAKFSTMANLLATLQKDSTCLNDITLCNKNGQAKKLTKPCINNIYDFLIKPAVISVNI
jgi:ERCC4-type nuclease